MSSTTMHVLVWRWVPSLLVCVVLLLVCEVDATEPNAETIVVSSSSPLSVGETELRESVFKKCQEMLDAPAGTWKAHPSAATFPGSVSAVAERVTREVKLKHAPLPAAMRPLVEPLTYSNPFRPTMMSTGLYAAPGEVVSIEVPPSLVGRVELQIGCHTDNLTQWVSARQDWRRMPLVVNRTPLEDETTDVSNPFGGLIYVLCSPRTEAWDGTITISGAVMAPLFVLGETTVPQWNAMLESTGAPWGEIAGDNIVLMLSTNALASIEDPTTCMELWDNLIEASMDLAQLPLPFYRKQRLVTDVQITVGSMHAGYPLMVTHCPKKGVNTERFLTTPAEFALPANGGPNWGFFHEVGHNLQNLDWVFDGTTEVSVNLFTLYAFDKIAGGRDGAHPGVSNERTQRVMSTYFVNGPDFQKWKSDPFLALTTFRILQSEFGWDLFKRSFRRYHTLAPDDRPRGDQQKRDRLVRYLSEEAQRDLSVYFSAWGVPLSDALSEDLKSLPEWMPFGFPPATNDDSSKDPNEDE